jgi:WD40 repeat protein
MLLLLCKGNERCAAGYDDGALRIYDLERTDMEAKFAPHDSSVQCLAFSPDGRLFFTNHLALQNPIIVTLIIMNIFDFFFFASFDILLRPGSTVWQRERADCDQQLCDGHDVARAERPRQIHGDKCSIQPS